MSMATGIWREGRIELRTPPPADWSEGVEVSIVRSKAPIEIDIRDEGPDALAAWIAWYDELDRTIGPSTFPDELERHLQREKTEELAAWDESCRRIEAVMP